VYWVDIPAARLHRYDPRSGAHETFDTGTPAGGFTIQPDGALLLFMARGAVRLWSGGGFAGTVVEEIPDERDSRFNDVIADPEGRVFAGTMSTAQRAGRLYRLDRDGSVRAVLEGIGTPNGMGFTPDLGRMYQTDTRALEIRLFDYDRQTGGLADGRVFARGEGGERGRPDGLTVDAEGCVWSARWDGGRIVRYLPDGAQIAEVLFPARKVSSLTFGGDGCSDIYVTTAGGDDRAANGPGAGALFRLRAGIRGVPEFLSRIRC
jgi:D-xylonolactonase